MSNKKQKGLKTRSTKKRANNWYPPTKKDWFLLERLESFGILSTQQIRELIFNNWYVPHIWTVAKHQATVHI